MTNILKRIIVRSEYEIFKFMRRRRLTNTNPTIFANNCLGGVIYHDLGLQFMSPMINVALWPKEYLKFLRNPQHYLSCPLVKTDEWYENKYPIARCDDIRIMMGHAPSLDISMAAWEKRKNRVNLDNLYITMVDAFGCVYEDIVAFSQLPYPNKVIFTHKPYPEIPCACYVRGYEELGYIGTIAGPKPTFWRRRVLDDFDYVSFLNQK